MDRGVRLIGRTIPKREHEGPELGGVRNENVEQLGGRPLGQWDRGFSVYSV